MSNISDAIERIKILECPTGDVEYRVAGILEDYDVAGRNEVKIDRDKRFDRDGAEAFNVKIPGNNGESIIVLAASGREDYVARVVDAYLS